MDMISENSETNVEPDFDDELDEFEFTPVESLGEHGEILSDHRGAFGEFGGTVEEGFLDRDFRERIIIVGVFGSDQTEDDIQDSLEELELLIDTAGADVVDRLVQKRRTPDPATYVGKGKVTEIFQACLAADADTVVFDNELSPGQQVNLEKILKRTALDRTAVILDIFAQHATTSEGKAQVELAQLKYNLPRLRGKKNFSQQGGGIGTRGPGETQLEVDRRRLVSRVHKLEKQLKVIQTRRDNQRKARQNSANKKVSIVGYTNAGKSSLLKCLTSADILVEDRLFATLDPTTKKYQMPGGEEILLTDTVGFVKKLPHQLVEAFKSTLEVAKTADLLIHVVDGAGADPISHIEAVHNVLEEIDAGEIPTILVFNKSDASEEVEYLANRFPGAVAVSALTGAGIPEMLAELSERIKGFSETYELFIPWARGDIIALVHREGQIVSKEDTELGVTVIANLEESSASRLAEFIEGKVERSD